MQVSNWYHVKELVNDMYEPVITSDTCTYVSKFQLKSVKMFLMSLWLECKNLVKNA